MTSIQAKDLAYIWHPCSQMKDYEEDPPIVIDRGKGVWLYDTDGKAYLDVISSWWCNLLGHCNSEIGDALKAQVDTLEHVIFAHFSHEAAIALCEELSAVVPPGLAKYNFACDGSSAVEIALKMAFQYQAQRRRPEKRRFMALSGAYHGETVGALSVGGTDLFSKMYRPLLFDVIRPDGPDCYRCPFGKTREDCSVECFTGVEASLEKNARECAAFIVEPLVQCAAGMRIYPAAYLRKLRAACDRYEVLLIADEIATGFGRTGEMFACTQAGVTPDILCVSKSITGGYLPLSITITTEEVYRAFYADWREGKAFLHSHTYSGNPLACAAALATLRILSRDKVLERAAENAPYLTEKLSAIMAGHPRLGEIRTIGLINAIELVDSPREKTPLDPALRTGYRVYREALKQGLLLRPLGDVLYFNPPLTITKDEIDEAVSRFARVIENAAL